MKIKMRQVLSKSPFDSYSLSAGDKGLENPVDYISVLETEPDQNEEVLLRTNVIYISSLYYQKQSEKQMLDYFKYLVHLRASGLIVIDDYIKEFPKTVLDFCNQNALPLLLIDHSIPYADMISSVMELIFLARQETITENTLAILETGSLSPAKSRELIRELNPQFLPRLTSFFVHYSKHELAKATELIDSINSNQRHLACKYKKGILLLCSHVEMSQKKYEDFVSSIVNSIHMVIPDASVGISNDVILDECGTAVFQSVLCLQTRKADIFPQCVRYKELGLYKLLSAFMGSKELELFYSETIEVIQEYDKQYNAQLFETMKYFLENECSYGRTARKMVVHENTIRYRISRIKELLQFQSSDMELFHTLSVAFKVHFLKH